MKLPKLETIAPGVECRTLRAGVYVITSNEQRSKFTLWKTNDGDYEKITTSKDIIALYGKIPWISK